MIPTRIQLENFLSFGSPPVEFCFTEDEPLWVLCGQNGTGKSAVFDGITYALYGEHRGGSQKHEQLIRHGANGFRVVFEFKFGDAEYRITRSRAKTTTQKVERKIDGEWVAEPGVNNARELVDWVARTLGLTCKAFTSSVLLKQGEADKLFSASRDERIEVLKRIIGFERFEEISTRVHAATLRHKQRMEDLQRRQDATEPVTPEELAAAETLLLEAEQQRQEAQQKLADAHKRIEQARQFQGLTARQAEVQRKVAEAEARAQDAEAIRAARLRLDDLTAAIPVLQALRDWRARMASAEPKLAAETAKLNETAAAIDRVNAAYEQARQQADQHGQQASELDLQAKSLALAIRRDTNLLRQAAALETLAAEIAQYPPDLAQQLQQAETDEKTASEASQTRNDQLTRAAVRQQQCQEQLERFTQVQVGTTCFHCGQFVDEHHAAKERARLNNDMRSHNAEVDQFRAQLDDAKARQVAAQTRLARLRTDKMALDKLTDRLDSQSKSLQELGDVANAAELRARLATHEQQKMTIERALKSEQAALTRTRADASKLEADRQKLNDLLKQTANALRQLEGDLATWRAQEQAKRDQLRADWHAQVETVDVAALLAERDRLRASDIEKRFALLQDDDRLRVEWAQQLADLAQDIDRIPPDARIAEKDARHQEAQARLQADRAEQDRDEAVRRRDHLRATLASLEKLREELRLAERAHELHKRLDDLLGQNGLQRELVRDAEQQIIALANETLQNLSDGDLALEPDEDVAGRDDKAFALRVRVAGLPAPVAVAFLSGSQKFRVAVSVALAIGRFASGRARPLEAVIIDEGFGSLDADGLRAMADELKRLQQSQSLKRVILVSHQEAFTSRFPVGYQLEAGENGTTAQRFRR